MNRSITAPARLLVLTLIFLLGVVLSIASGVPQATSAQADETPAATQATITGATFKNSTVEDTYSYGVDLTWSLPDSRTGIPELSLELPKVLPAKAATFKLTANDASQTELGSCTVTAATDEAPSRVDCTFTNATYLESHNNVSGVITIAGTVKAGNADTITPTFTFGGATANLTITPLVQCTDCTFTEQAAKKSGSVKYDATSDQYYIEWTLYVPTDGVHGLPAGKTITLSDAFQTSEPSLSYLEGSARVAYSSVLGKDATGKTKPVKWYYASSSKTPVTVADITNGKSFTFTTPSGSLSPTDYTLQDGQSFVTAEGSNTRQAYYQVEFKTLIDTEVKAPAFGTQYSNTYSGTIDGTTFSGASGRAISHLSTGWGGGELSANQWALKLTKTVDGTGVASVDSGTVYTIRYQVKASDSAEWGEWQTTSILASDLNEADDYLVLPFFDLGSTVRLSEVLPANTDTVTWSAPMFDGAQTLIDADGSITGTRGAAYAEISSPATSDTVAVRVINTATLVDDTKTSPLPTEDDGKTTPDTSATDPSEQETTEPNASATAEKTLARTGASLDQLIAGAALAVLGAAAVMVSRRRSHLS